MRSLPLVVVLASCNLGGDNNTDTDVTGWQADPRADVVDCPNGPSCEPSDDKVLKAGVASGSITPECWETWLDNNGDHLYQPSFGETHRDDFLDCGCDRLCPEDEGYTAPDEGEGDGLFHPIWMAGFDNARAAMGVRPAELGFLGEGDGLQARAIVFEQGNTRLALVSLDAMGVMYDDVLRIRQAVADAGVDVDHVLVTSSHTHSGPDTMGIYGRTITETGYDAGYAAQIADTVVDLVQQATGALEPVSMRVGQIDANSVYPNGIDNLISDLRDPQIADPRVGALQLKKQDGSTLATIVHFANHPETIADENNWLTADFVHGVRRSVTEGVRYQDGTPGHTGVGGTTIYVQGTVGGMMTSLHASVTDPTGAVFRDHSWDKVDTVGALIGDLALQALDHAVDVPDPSLRFVARQIYLPVDNIGFQAMFTLGLFAHRPAFHYDPSKPISDDNAADVQSEIDLVQLGPVRMLSLPGEVLPEDVIGGYDGAYTAPGGVLIDPENENPPDLTKAPAGPYLLDELGGDPSWIIGLGNDEIGYIVPPYNFELAGAAYLDEAPGDHYEETNSLGPRTWPTLDTLAREVLAYVDGD